MQKWAVLAPNTRKSATGVRSTLSLCSGLATETSAALSTAKLETETFQ